MPRRHFTDKQKIFIKAYLDCKSATQAAIVAGYSLKSAKTIGAQLLGLPHIRAEIEAGLDAEKAELERRARKKMITKERWLEKIAKIAFSNMDVHAQVTERGVTLTKTDQRPKGAGHAIKRLHESQSKDGGSQSIELHDPLRALELIGKHFGWIKEQHELSGPNGGPIQTQIGAMSDEELEAENARLDQLVADAKAK